VGPSLAVRLQRLGEEVSFERCILTRASDSGRTTKADTRPAAAIRIEGGRISVGRFDVHTYNSEGNLGGSYLTIEFSSHQE